MKDFNAEQKNRNQKHYTCETCGKSFSEAVSLKKHITITNVNFVANQQVVSKIKCTQFTKDTKTTNVNLVANYFLIYNYFVIF